MTSNPETNSVKNTQRMTRSQTKRNREEEEIQSKPKRAKIETLKLELSSSSSPIIITKTEQNPNLFDTIKQMKSTQDEIKAEIRKIKQQKKTVARNHLEIIKSTDETRETLWDELEVNQEAYVEKRNVLWSLHREIQILKTRIKELRGEEVFIEGQEVTFKLINEE